MIEHNDESYNLEDTKKFLPETEQKLPNGKVKFAGLTKEEVLAYSTDPTWVKLRWIFFILFWVVWFALLGSAVTIVATANSCPFRPKLEWWETKVVYQVDVERFRDTDGDGVGDLAGVLEKLDHFREMRVEALNLRSSKLLAGDSKLSPKHFKKAIKRQDMNVIIDVPYEMVSNDKQVLVDWLTTFDGVRVYDVPTDADSAKLKEFVETAKQISTDTFESKFIGFLPYAPETLPEELPSTLFRAPLTENPFATQETKQAFLSGLQKESEKNVWPSFLTSDYSSNRLSAIITDLKQLRIAHGMMLLLKSTPFVLYGDELEMDKKNQFMKWNSAANCGFSSNKTVSVGDCTNTANDLTSHGAGNNLVKIYRQLALLRTEPSFAWGALNMNSEATNVVSFVREAPGFDGYLVAANVADKASGSTNFKALHNIPKNGTVSYFYSDSELSAKEFAVGLNVATEKIILKPGELLVVRFDKR